MTFTNSIVSCMSKYATFSGRAIRSEFWWFYLFTILLSWAAQITGAIMYPTVPGQMPPIEASVAYWLVSLALLMPTLSVMTRRLHDIDRSGWWLLLILTGIGLILLIFWWAKDTQTSENRFGVNPKVAEIIEE